MSGWLNAPRSAYRRATIPAIWVALALSLLVHIGVLWVWLPSVHLLSVDNPERDNASGPLVVQLASQSNQVASIPPAPPALPALQAQPPPTHRLPPTKATPRPSSALPVVALGPVPDIASPPAPPTIAAPASAIAVPPAAPPVAAPAPEIASPPSPSVAVAASAVARPPPASGAAPAAPPLEGDLSSYIETRRRARGEVAASPPAVAAQSRSPSAPPIEDDKERSNRIIAANLGLGRTPTVGYDPKGGGGIFEIQRIGYDAAEFIFYGWNKDIRRNSKQLIEVAKGDNSDIRIAVVRRMIAIIRAEESGDFLWVSQRLGRTITLSARPSENAELEDFMMQEFFAAPRRLN